MEFLMNNLNLLAGGGAGAVAPNRKYFWCCN